MADYIPSNDLQFQQWADHFVSECQGSGTTYGLSAPQIAALAADQASFNLAYQDSEIARVVARTATQEKDAKRSAYVTKIRAAANIIQSDADTTNAIRAAYGLPERNSGTSPVPVFIPQDVIVGAYSNGVNVLRWAASGNRPGTTYLIEFSIDDAETWQLAGVTTKRKFDHEGQTPGQKTAYRIKAVRASRSSLFSDLVWVYSNTNQESVTYYQAA